MTTPEQNQKADFSDEPLADAAEDKFDRKRFAEQVAGIIRRHPPEKPLVVGLYGEWGDGKSTILKFLKCALEGRIDRHRIVVTEFDPWAFHDAGDLLHGYLDKWRDLVRVELADGGSDHKELLGRLLKTVGKLLDSTPASGLGGVAQDVGTSLSTRSHRQLCAEIGEFLKKAEARIVVLVDDLDRLDSDQIHEVAKLVKLTAALPFVTYVLAFDDQVVEAALAQRFPPNGRFGSNFLDKIVQVPLRIPPVRPDLWNAWLRSRISERLSLLGVPSNLHPTQVELQLIDSIVGSIIRTPRDVKRWLNTYTALFPLINGEVHPVDFLLLSVIQVFAPTVHSRLQSEWEFLLAPWIYMNPEQNTGKRRAEKAFIDRILPESDRSQPRALAIIQILRHLFPSAFERSNGITASAPGIQANRSLAENRVSNAESFNRYFELSLRGVDVHDLELQFIEEAALAGRSSDLISELRQLSNRVGAGPVAARLASRRRLHSSSGVQACMEGLLKLHLEAIRSEVAQPLSEPAFLAALAEMLMNCDLDERGKIVESMVDGSMDFRFIRMTCHLATRQFSGDVVIGEDEQAKLLTKVSGRVEGRLEERGFASLDKESLDLIALLCLAGHHTKVEEFLAAGSKRRPILLLEYLRLLCGTLWPLVPGSECKPTDANIDALQSHISLPRLRTLIDSALESLSDEVKLQYRVEVTFAQSLSTLIGNSVRAGEIVEG